MLLCAEKCVYGFIAVWFIAGFLAIFFTPEKLLFFFILL